MLTRSRNLKDKAETVKTKKKRSRKDDGKQAVPLKKAKVFEKVRSPINTRSMAAEEAAEKRTIGPKKHKKHKKAPAEEDTAQKNQKKQKKHKKAPAEEDTAQKNQKKQKKLKTKVGKKTE